MIIDSEEFEVEIDKWKNKVDIYKDAADTYKMHYYSQIDCTERERRKKEYWIKRYKRILKKYKNVMNNGSE